MKSMENVALMSSMMLALVVVQPIMILADTTSDAEQTAVAIDYATNSDRVVVQDAEINQPVLTADGDLEVTLPQNSTQAVELNDVQDGPNISVDLPSEFKSKAIDTGDTLVYKGNGANLGLQEINDGFRALIYVTDSSASHSYSFDLNLPKGYQLIDSSSAEGLAEGTEDVYVMNEDGDISYTIAAPWAKDTNGQSVPTHYEISGTVLTQVIDFNSDNFVPVVADPAISMGGQKAFKAPDGKWVVVSSKRVSASHPLTFIYKVGNGALYYDKTIRKYVYRQSGTATAVYVAQIVANGWAGAAGNAGAYVRNK